MQKATQEKFNELVNVISTLRGPNGCNWKKALTLHTLPPYSREEFEELMQAVKNQDWENIREELGDVLFHVLLYSQIASEQGKFSVDDVLDEIIAKMRRRNPHVFGNLKITNPAEIEKMWAEIKRKEKKEKEDTLKKKRD